MEILTNDSDDDNDNDDDDDRRLHLGIFSLIVTKIPIIGNILVLRFRIRFSSSHFFDVNTIN